MRRRRLTDPELFDALLRAGNGQSSRLRAEHVLEQLTGYAAARGMLADALAEIEPEEERSDEDDDS